MNLQDLRKSPLFEGLSDDELKHLMDNAKRVSLRAGDVLMKQGDFGDTAYVIVNGDLEVTKQSGQSVIKIDVRNPGDVLGEMALLSQSPRSATVTAVTDCETLCISKEVFDNLLSTSPSAAKAVLHCTIESKRCFAPPAGTDGSAGNVQRRVGTRVEQPCRCGAAKRIGFEQVTVEVASVDPPDRIQGF